MPTFDGNIQTRTRVALGRDAFTPNMGVIDPASDSMTEDAWIHGRQSVMVDDDAFHTYLTNLDEEVTVKYTVKDLTYEHNTGANSTERVTGIKSSYVTASSHVFVTGPSTYVYIGPHQDLLMSQRSTAQPVSWLTYVQEQTKTAVLTNSIFGSKNEGGLTSVSVVAIKNDVNVMKNGLFAFKNENKGIDTKNRALSNDIKALGSRITALASKLGGLRAYVAALKASAGPNVGPNDVI
jgi:hypothetical protein